VIAFKLDENLPTEAVALLQQDGHDVSSVIQQGLVGHADPEVSRVCRSEGRVLVTLDVDFANVQNYPPRDYPGIIVVRLARQGRRQVLAVLDAVRSRLDPAELTGKLWIVEESRIRIRE
jgi:predicted nuclease of predicted toxin-antitoxin system